MGGSLNDPTPNPNDYHEGKAITSMVGALNAPTPNPEDHHQGKAIYANGPVFYSNAPEAKKPECKINLSIW